MYSLKNKKSNNGNITKNLDKNKNGKWDDLFTDANPSDTVHIKYKTLKDVKCTISNLENQYKLGNKTHKRISQIANLMKVRLGLIRNNSTTEYKLANKYTQFLKQRTLKKPLDARKKLTFK